MSRPSSFSLSWSSAIWLFCLLFGCSIRVAVADDDRLSQVIQVPPQSTQRSAHFHLQAGDSFVVTGASSDVQFAVDIYVYDHQTELSGKDRDDSESPTFEWTAYRTGEYYVLIRNISLGRGEIKIRIVNSKAIANANAPGYAEMKIYYATDRELKDIGSPDQFFGTDPDLNHPLRLGECSVNIPRAHKMGELEGPSIFRLEFSGDPNKHILLQRVEEESSAIFFRNLAERVRHSSSREVLLFIPGFNTSFSDGTRRTAQLAYDLGFDGPAVLYSWSSQGVISLTAYNHDRENAELTIPRLEQLLMTLAATANVNSIDIIAHSMGNLPLLRALEQMELGSANGERNPHINQVILMAPDVDTRAYRQLSANLKREASRTTMYASSRDEALKVAQKLAEYPRAGQGGPQIAIVPEADTIDASSVDTSTLGFNHQYYADSSTILSDVFNVLRDEPIEARFGLKRQLRADGTYWQFAARN